jgi:signal transduction histidine kinase
MSFMNSGAPQHAAEEPRPRAALIAALSTSAHRVSGWASNVYRHYERYHQYGPPRLAVMGWVGVAAFTLFYFFRFSRPHPNLQDDLVLRPVVLLLFLGMALQKRWPARFKRYYYLWSYVTLLVGLPFFSVYEGLERGGGMPNISNCFIAAAFITLLVDWRNLIVMVAVGVGIAVVAFKIGSPGEVIPRDIVAQTPAYLLILVAGYFFKLSTEQVEQQKRHEAQQEANERRLAALGDTLGFMAHELNTPLGTVRGCVTVLKSRVRAVAPGVMEFRERHEGDLLQLLERSERAALYCQTLVSSFVQNTRHASPGIITPDGTASGLLRSLMREYPFEQSEREWVTVRLEEDFRVTGRRDLVYLVLCTIVKNALQAIRMQPNPRLEIVAGLEAEAVDDRIVERGWIRLADTGAGIPDTLLQKLTHEPVTTREAEGGTGMGLVFCRRVMESMGGGVTVTSTQGHGTTVLLEFDPTREPA